MRKQADEHMSRWVYADADYDDDGEQISKWANEQMSIEQWAYPIIEYLLNWIVIDEILSLIPFSSKISNQAFSFT